MQISCPTAASCITPDQIVAVLGPLAGSAVVLLVGLVAIGHMARHKFLGLLATIAAGALVYLAVKGNLIQDVVSWLQQLGF